MTTELKSRPLANGEPATIPPRERLLRLYREMVLIRRCEEQLAKAHQRGLIQIPWPAWLADSEAAAPTPTAPPPVAPSASVPPPAPAASTTTAARAAPPTPPPSAALPVTSTAAGAADDDGDAGL